MRVAFLGLGIMGSRMAANLARRRARPRRLEPHAGEGRRLRRHRRAPTPAEAARGAEVVITMVVDGPQVEAVLLGDDGAATAAREGTLFVDMSTIGPTAARAIGAALAERGLRFVDAPVTGSSPKAEAGTLTIMAGGEAADVERARALFEAMGETIVHAGALGQGQMVKLINNALAAANAVALAQALLAGKAAGADLDALVAVMGAGSAGSAMLDLKAGPDACRTTSPRSSRPSTCSRTSACASRRREAAGRALPRRRGRPGDPRGGGGPRPRRRRLRGGHRTARRVRRYSALADRRPRSACADRLSVSDFGFRACYGTIRGSPVAPSLVVGALGIPCCSQPKSDSNAYRIQGMGGDRPRSRGG